MHPVHRIFGRRFYKNRGEMACFAKNGVEKRNVIFEMDLLGSKGKQQKMADVFPQWIGRAGKSSPPSVRRGNMEGKKGVWFMEVQVYMASDVQKALGIGKTKTYEFLNQVYNQKEPLFRVIKIGTSVRIQKRSFDNWLNAVADGKKGGLQDGE